MWSSAKAALWLKKYADELASDAYNSGGSWAGNDTIYAAAGAAYYAFLHRVGYQTKIEFRKFLLKQVGLDRIYVEEIIEEIEG